MKVLGISCGRRNGNGELLLKRALKTVEENGHEVEYLRLQDFYIAPCTGCELCSGPESHKDGVFTPKCVHKWDEDDFQFIIEKVLESDGLIISAPAYQLTVPGILFTFFNRIHCYGFARHTKEADAQKRVFASIGVGGSDMLNLFSPFINFIGTELCGSQMDRLIDQMLVYYCAPIKGITLRPEAFARAERLGQNIAEALMELPGRTTYRGDKNEVCPVCHNDIVQIQDGKVRCPVCNFYGKAEIVDGLLKVTFDGGEDASRFKDNAAEEKMHKQQRSPYEAVKEHKDEVDRVFKEWTSYLQPLKKPGK